MFITEEIKSKMQKMSAEGKVNSEIGKHLGIKKCTVQYHLAKMKKDTVTKIKMMDDGKSAATATKKVSTTAQTTTTQKVSTTAQTTTTQKVSAVVGYIHGVPVKFDMNLFSSIKEIIISKHGFQLTFKDGTTRSFGE